MCSEREEKCGWAKGELTALLLITHITAVVPAVTLKIFCNAKARPTGEFSRASCPRITEKRTGTEEKGHKMATINWVRGSDGTFTTSITLLIRAIINPFWSSLEMT